MDDPHAAGVPPENVQAAPDPKQAIVVTPDQLREIMRQQATGMAGGMAGALGVHVQMGPAPNVIAEKLTPDHITSVIANFDSDRKREDSRLRQYFWGSLGAFVLLCIVFLAYGQQTLLEKILPLLVAFGSGFAGGYGYKGAKKV